MPAPAEDELARGDTPQSPADGAPPAAATAEVGATAVAAAPTGQTVEGSAPAAREAGGEGECRGVAEEGGLKEGVGGVGGSPSGRGGVERRTGGLGEGERPSMAAEERLMPTTLQQPGSNPERSVPEHEMADPLEASGERVQEGDCAVATPPEPGSQDQPESEAPPPPSKDCKASPAPPLSVQNAAEESSVAVEGARKDSGGTPDENERGEASSDESFGMDDMLTMADTQGTACLY